MSRAQRCNELGRGERKQAGRSLALLRRVTEGSWARYFSSILKSKTGGPRETRTASTFQVKGTLSAKSFRVENGMKF